MTDRLKTIALLLALGACLLPGCGGPPVEKAKPTENSPAAGASTSANPEAKSPAESASAPTTSPADAAASKSAPVPTTPAAPAKAEPPFNPPATLAELEKDIEWEDMPVRNSMKLLEEHLAKSKPLVSVEEALRLKNDSAESNDKIRSALGRPPENPQQVNWNARVTRHLLGDIKNTNPIMINSVEEFDVTPFIRYALFTFDWNLDPFADAETVVKWQTSKDRLYDKIELRRDCTWSDGKPITAHDVAFSFQAIMNPKIPVPAVRSQTDQLLGAVAYDDYTVVLFHKQSLATNVWNVNFPVIPKHIYEPLFAKLDEMKWPELLQQPEYQRYENNPVSGGAYSVESRTRNQEIILKRREDWYSQNGQQVRAKPYFEEVRFRVITDPNTALLALMSGELDEYLIQMDQWSSQTTGADFYNKNTKVRAVEWLYFYFGWNNNSDAAPFFRDKRVREAMSYAFDYKELLDKLLYGLCDPCTGIWYPTAWMAPKTPLKAYQQSLDKAEKLLDEAGWTDSDGNGIRDKMVNGRKVQFEFNMLVRQDPERIRICELMKFNLEQIGVRCNVQPLEVTVLTQRMNETNYQAYYGGWGSGSDPDTSENIWGSKEIPPNGRNYLQYSNPEVDQLFIAGKKEFDRDKRAQIYAKIDELIYQDQPCTFLFYRNAFYGFNKQLRGYYFSPRGPYHYGPGFSSIWRAAN